MILRIFLIGCIATLFSETFGQCNQDYQLFWSDEFELSEVNTDKWVVKNEGGGFGNQEVQLYQPQNATVSDGLLHIKIANETAVNGSTTYQYTSAKLETASKVNFQYGKIEARIKMPDAVGSWPAFWMLGSDIGTVGWPHCGEIDIMEWVGRGPDVASGSIFFDGTWPDNHLSTPYNIPSGQSFITDFHTFAIEWEPNEIRYYCDGNKYATYKNTTIAPKNWYFNHEFFVILNCAIGGSGGGSVINIPTPKYMEVDYVRVYSLPETALSIKVSGSKSLMANSQNVLYTTNYFPNTTYAWTLPNGAIIVDGQGTNTIHASFAAQGGEVKVEALNSCSTLSDILSVNIVVDECAIVYDNFDAIRNVSYQATGALVENYANPSIDAVNASAFVAQYGRDVNETYDVLGVYDIALENALGYENGTKVFFMDIYTSAPIGTQITLQLESSALNAGTYPQGRRSAYIAHTTKLNEWHTVQFNFNQIISAATSPDQIDHIALLFDPGITTSDVYYLDNFKRLKSTDGCTNITDITEQKMDYLISVYPNPVNDILYIKDKKEDQPFCIYNGVGDKVLENSGNKVDVSRLLSGIYLLKTGKATLKFVKQ